MSTCECFLQVPGRVGPTLTGMRSHGHNGGSCIESRWALALSASSARDWLRGHKCSAGNADCGADRGELRVVDLQLVVWQAHGADLVSTPLQRFVFGGCFTLCGDDGDDVVAHMQRGRGSSNVRCHSDLGMGEQRQRGKDMAAAGLARRKVVCSQCRARWPPNSLSRKNRCAQGQADGCQVGLAGMPRSVSTHSFRRGPRC